MGIGEYITVSGGLPERMASVPMADLGEKLQDRKPGIERIVTHGMNVKKALCAYRLNPANW